MAQPIPCANQDGIQADFLIGNLHNGDQTPLCAQCLLPWAIGMTEQLIAEMGENEKPEGEEAIETATEAGPAETPAPAFPPEAEPAGKAGGSDGEVPEVTPPEPAPDPVGDPGVEPGA
jgi:hypothetical protein